MPRTQYSASLRTAPLLAALAALATVFALSGGRGTPARAALPRVRAAASGLSFEANAGQAPTGIRFVTRAAGGSVSIGYGRAAVRFRSADGRVAAVTSRLVGARTSGTVAGERRLAATVNYLQGNHPEAWLSGVPTFGAVRCQGVYPGIDQVFHRGTQAGSAGLEYDFVVAPGADPAVIRIAFDGAQRVRIEPSGDLVMATSAGEIRHHRPVAYQEYGGRRISVPGFGFRLSRSDGEPLVEFEPGSYDRSLPLVIDPLLSFSTYFGGAANDDGSAIATDSAGNSYVAGGTVSLDFPTLNPYQGALAGGALRSDVWVAKFSPAGALLYSTYLGGSGTDAAYGIAVDSQGRAYVTGKTDSTDFPSTLGVVQPSRAGGDVDAFVARLTAAGSGLDYATYLGGTGQDFGTAIAVDGAFNAHITGFTASTNFPTVNALQPNPGSTPAFGDAFVAKLNSDATSLIYSTYLGGNRQENVSPQDGGIAIDADGNACVTGTTYSPDFPTTAGALDRTYGPILASPEAFVAKITPSGGSLLWSTYLGGSGDDTGRGIAVDATGALAVVGSTSSSDFPTLNARQPAYGGGGTDAYVARIAADGKSLLWSTYLGGSASDSAQDVALDDAGNVYVTGSTFSADFPTANLIQPALGSFDAFVTKISPSGSKLVYSTYLGGTSQDIGMGVAVDPAGNAHVTGSTLSTNFPVASAHQPAPGGSGDAFVLTLSDGVAPPGLPTGLTVAGACDHSALLTWTDNADNEDAFEIERRTGNGQYALVGAVEANVTAFTDFTVLPNSQYTYRVRATNGDGASAYSNEAAATTAAGPPPTPSGVSVEVLSKTSLRVHWDDIGTTETGYRVERSPDAGAHFSPAGSVAANTLAFTDAGLTPNTPYTYRVVTLVGGCESLPSASATGTTLPDPPAAPTGLTAHAISESQISVTWTDSSSNETGFKLERKNGSGAFAVVQTLPANATQATDTGLAASTPYVYRVKAFNGDGDSPPSEEKQATTFGIPIGKLKVPATLNFGKLTVGSVKTLTLNVVNASRTDRLAVTLGTVAAPFSITAGGGSGQVVIGGTRVVTVKFTPTAPGKFKQKLNIQSSDPKKSSVNVTLTGTAK